MKNKTLWRFTSDEDGHWYLLPANEYADFHAHLSDIYDDTSDDYDRYTSYRINCPSEYAFEMPILTRLED